MLQRLDERALPTNLARKYGISKSKISKNKKFFGKKKLGKDPL